MHLTRYTDFSFRLLMALGLEPGRAMTIRQVSELYGISRNHLVKVVNRLHRLGLVETTRGRRGGVRLAVPPAAIELGTVVRAVEPSFQLADCFADGTPSCVIAGGCGLRSVLHEALDAFFAVLDGHTLADLLERRGDLRAMFAASPPAGDEGAEDEGPLVQIGSAPRERLAAVFS